ncbi:MAG TPA: TonB-dependent receptor [Vicinamibacterales bacterium]|nr:TonB-dependent receptor [Vicinamibacterales bacterium]
MKRWLFVLALVAAFAAPAFAQIEGGSIGGTIKDEQGGVLPGVSVTAQGVDATLTAVTDAAGEFRFLNLAPGPYKVTAALQGFATIVRDQVIVSVGKNVELPMMLKVSGVSETITVSGESPIVDTKATGTATNFTSDELTKIPTSRDPFALMRSVPGVLVDRVNIGGNETGQQSNFASKGTRPQDAVWTMDGINITDMAATGASPSYYNYDNFEEIQVSTAGQDIKQPTGGMGLNLVVKRGTNRFAGGFRGYFDNHSLESSNVPAELAAIGVTYATSDHNQQIGDYGYDIGGPIWKDHAWFYNSYSYQDVKLVRRAGAFIDETKLKNPDVKLNWQATKKDMVSFLYFDGFKIKDGRSPGISGILFDAPTATYHQDNAYTGNPLHGLWKIADDRVFGSNFFVSGKAAFFNTGFILTPESGLTGQAGRSFTTAQSFGSINQTTNIRPQHIYNVDANSFLSGAGWSHDLKYGFGYRTAEAFSGNVYPGNMILAIENSPTDLRAQVFRQAAGSNKAYYTDLYVGDTLSKGRVTVDAGLRYDQQWGKALPSQTLANVAFPNVVPGLVFSGYDTPFTWKNASPRVGLTYALDEARRTVARASFSRYAGQLETGTVGVTNPSTTIGSATYRWVDLNGDHFAQANEVLLNQFITSAGGFNPANPTAVTSSNVLDPNLAAPKTSSLVVGLDRELLPNLAAQVNYSYTRTTDLFGNFTGRLTPRTGVSLANYAPGAGFSGTLPDGTPYNVATYIPNAAAVAAGGNGFLTTNIPDYDTDYHGLELGLVKRLSNRWMGRVGFSWNNAREHFASAAGMYDTNGNPTPTLSEPLKDGGQFAPQSGGSGSGNIYINAKWQFNANALYQAPYGIEVSGNVFGRQGYPYPLFRQGTTATLGADSSLSVLVTPQIDYFRYPNLWNTDLRASRTWKLQTVSLRGILDCFNVFNANTELVRNNNIASTSFNQIAQNLSPRIFRIGLVVGF